MNIYFFSVFDLWPYILLMFLFIVSLSTSKKVGETIAFMSIYLFAICRYRIGWDYIAYESLIKSTSDINYEFFSKLILSYSRHINFYPLAFFIFSTISLLLIRFMLNNYSSYPALSWLIYFTFPLYFFQDLGTIRQSVALSIIFFSYHFFLKKQYLLCLSLIFLASLFHISAIMGFIVFAFYFVKLNLKYNIVLFIFGIIISQFCSLFISSYQVIISNFLSHTFLSSKVEFYLDNSLVAYRLTSFLYLFWIIEFLCLLFYKKLVNYDFHYKSYITLSNFGIFFYGILQVIEPTTALRFSLMFIIFWLLLLPSFIYIVPITFYKFSKFFIYFLSFSLLFYMIGIYINACNGIMENACYLPYRFWWNYL